MPSSPLILFFFFFNDTATTEIYTLSLHDALPICDIEIRVVSLHPETAGAARPHLCRGRGRGRSEEHTSELQSRLHLVCRLLLEKKKIASAALFNATTTNTIAARSLPASPAVPASP